MFAQIFLRSRRVRLRVRLIVRESETDDARQGRALWAPTGRATGSEALR